MGYILELKTQLNSQPLKGQELEWLWGSKEHEGVCSLSAMCRMPIWASIHYNHFNFIF